MYLALRSSGVVLLWLCASRSGAAQVGAAAEFLPQTVAVYATIADPPALLATLLEHPLRGEFERLPQIVAAKKQAEYLQFRLALQFFEIRIGQAWRPALEKLARHGVTIALDPKTEGVVLLARSDDPALLGRTRDGLLEMVRNHAKEHDQPDLLRDVDYRGIAAHKIGDLGAALVDDWLVVTNKIELGRQVLDRLLGDDLPTLAHSDAFRSACEAGDSSSGWAWIDLAKLQDAGVAKDLFRGQSEDFGGELILGGVLAAISESRYATVAIDVDADGAQLTATLPRDEATSAPRREYFFGVDNRGVAPPAIRVERRLGAIRAHRDIASLWRLAPDIFNQQVNANLAKAESDLSTIFGGKSFSDDILASLGPDVQLVVARQSYGESGAPTPAIQLPAGAAVFRLIEPEESQRPLKIAFQTLVGFLNLDAGQKGRSPLELSMERLEGATIVATTYDPSDVAEGEEADIQFNFSPTLAFVDSWLVLSSTRDLALEIVGTLAHGSRNRLSAGEPDAIRSVNTAIDVSMTEVADLLADNRENLIAQNMLEEGRPREDAEAHVATIERVVQALAQAHLELATVDETLQLRLDVKLGD